MQVFIEIPLNDVHFSATIVTILITTVRLDRYWAFNGDDEKEESCTWSFLRVFTWHFSFIFVCVALPCAPVCFHLHMPVPVLKAEAAALKRARKQATIQRKRDFEQLQRSKVGNAHMSTRFHRSGKPLSMFCCQSGRWWCATKAHPGWVVG